jgi:hypothetical protein
VREFILTLQTGLSSRHICAQKLQTELAGPCEPSGGNTSKPSLRPNWMPIEGRHLRNQRSWAFDPQNKSVEAAGTLNHKATNGTVLETGVWLASDDLLQLLRRCTKRAHATRTRTGLQPPQVGQKRPTMRGGSLPTGGLAVFRILLMTVSGGSPGSELRIGRYAP